MRHGPRQGGDMGQATFLPRDLAKYRLSEAILQAASGRPTGIYAEADTEIRRRTFSGDTAGNRAVARPNSLLIPNEVLTRDMTVAGVSGSENLVGTEQTGEYISPFEPLLVTRKAGAQVLSGLVGNVAIPKGTTSTAYWLGAEGDAITEAQPTITQALLTPKNVCCLTEFSRLMLTQSTPKVDQLLARELTNRIAAAIDKAVLQGAGSGGEPQGIIGTSGVGSVSGTSLAAAGIIEFQTDVAANDAPLDACSYVTTPAVAGLLMQRPALPTTGTTPMWTGPLSNGLLLGAPAYATSQMPTAKMIYGPFGSVIIGEWGATEIAVNPYEDFTRGKLAIRAWASVDVAVRHPNAFSVAASIT